MAIDLVKRVRGQQCVVQAGAFMEEIRLKTAKGVAGADSGTGGEVAPLLDRLNTWNSEMRESKIIDFPPAFESVPCKPVFFDLAFNHIEFPNMTQFVKKKETGVLGKLAGWFGGKK